MRGCAAWADLDGGRGTPSEGPQHTGGQLQANTRFLRPARADNVTYSPPTASEPGEDALDRIQWGVASAAAAGRGRALKRRVAAGQALPSKAVALVLLGHGRSTQRSAHLGSPLHPPTHQRHPCRAVHRNLHLLAAARGWQPRLGSPSAHHIPLLRLPLHERQQRHRQALSLNTLHREPPHHSKAMIAWCSAGALASTQNGFA